MKEVIHVVEHTLNSGSNETKRRKTPGCIRMRICFVEKKRILSVKTSVYKRLSMHTRASTVDLDSSRRNATWRSMRHMIELSRSFARSFSVEKHLKNKSHYLFNLTVYVPCSPAFVLAQSRLHRVEVRTLCSPKMIESEPWNHRLNHDGAA